jgi:RHS repeat-associated protein
LNFETITENDPGIAYTYDALGRVKTLTTTLGATTTAYNDWETRVTDPENNYKDTLYDARGNLTEVKEYLDSTPYSTDYDYDQNNNLTKVTDAEGNEFEMAYDWLGRRLTQELLHDASEQSPNSYGFTYDANGNVATRTDAKSQTITYAYDELDRVLTENTNEVAYGYDSGTNGIGRLTSTSFSGGTKTLEYNLAGTLKKERVTIDSTNYDTQFTYDLLGNVLTVTYPDSTVVSYAYNNAGQLEAVLGYASDFDYSPSGLISYIAYANGVTTANTYDIQQLYRLTNRLTESGADDLQDIAYTYDDVGDITAIVDTSDTNASKSAAYGYDDLYRLTSATITNTGNSQNYTQTYVYSVTGNITNKSDVGSYTYGNIHPQAVTGANGVTYAYDANGSLTSDGTWTHTWNGRNQIVFSTDGTTTVTYAYDESGRRLIKDDGTTETLYINRYFDKEGANSVAYIYGGNLKLATKKDSSTAFHHLDHLSGSNVSTDSNGDTLELNDYYPYGSSRIDQRTGGYTNNYLFTGKELDQDTRLYYYGTRYYNATLGRFVSADTWFGGLGDPQSLNKFAYARNNPLMYVDPSGNVFALALALPALEAIAAKIVEVASVVIMTSIVVHDIQNPPLISYPAPIAEKPVITTTPSLPQEKSIPTAVLNTTEPGLGVISDPALPADKSGPLVTPVYQDTAGGVCGRNMSCATGNDHGNSITYPGTTWGYSLRNIDTGELLKYGQTIDTASRYTKKYLDSINAELKIETSGTKQDVREWETNKINEYKNNNGGDRPPLNKNDH